LNSKRLPPQWRSGWLSNLILGAATALFCVLAAKELIGMFGRFCPCPSGLSQTCRQTGGMVSQIPRFSVAERG